MKIQNKKVMNYQEELSNRRQAVIEILNLLPEQLSSFKGSEYPLPVGTALLGNKDITIPSLRRRLVEQLDGDVKDLVEPLLLAAELYEASRDDKEQFFLTDRAVQSYVFDGSKWSAGWVLVLGGEDQKQLLEKLKDYNFMVFTDLPDMSNTVYIGSRPTSPIYFLQLMVRYGLVWGRINPGDGHEMTHFLEEDMPGFIIIYKDLSHLKYLVALGLMKMGAPAVVPSTFPFPYGRRIVADGLNEIIEKGSHFPNLRQRYYKRETIRLPEYCNPAFAGESIEVGRNMGGKPHSFFCVRPVKQVDRQGARIIGQPVDDIGILVEIAAENLNEDIALTIENTALKAINFLSGVRAYTKGDIFHLELGTGVELNEGQISEAVYRGIRLKFPRLEMIAILIIFDPDRLKTEAEDIRRYKKHRRQLLSYMTEENTDDFCVCIECRPFSLEHTCIITPERMPMCGSRTYASVKAAAYFSFPNTSVKITADFDSLKIPWKRQSEKELPLRHVFKKGNVLDANRGEYEGSNLMYRKFTGGRLNRVYLHSLRGYPHTSCGCFKAISFWLEEVKGIGIMLRDSNAVSPDGLTWAMLANRAGGKQNPGVMGVSIGYIRSPHFLKGDGGIANVVWVDSVLYTKISSLFSCGQEVATEKDVQTLEELKRFLGR
ncbi:MAG: hypothetical protein M1497_09865 [Nitrospirae bacterium]|nr:hypothetical protein [Nitrospirota bacterium]